MSELKIDLQMRAYVELFLKNCKQCLVNGMIY